MQSDTSTPPGAPGLDLFAAAWIDRWIAHGGSIIVNPDGTGHSFCRANASDAPDYKEPSPDWPEDLRQRQMSWDEGVFTGRTLELLDLLEIIPGGREAVKAHVRQFPSFAYQGGTVGIS